VNFGSFIAQPHYLDLLRGEGTDQQGMLVNVPFSKHVWVQGPHAGGGVGGGGGVGVQRREKQLMSPGMSGLPKQHCCSPELLH
jgi:hypothetical protein